MHFSSLYHPALLSLLISSARGTRVSYDRAYNVSSTSLNNVACSDGPNGLETRGFDTFGSIPNFPSIGGASTVAGWNSDKCGACYKLTYTNTSIYITAVDHAGVGFNIALPALEALLGSQAAVIGAAEVAVEEVVSTFCGFK